MVAWGVYSRPLPSEIIGSFSNDDGDGNQGPVARGMVSVNQRLIPWQLIGFDTA